MVDAGTAGHSRACSPSAAAGSALNASAHFSRRRSGPAPAVPGSRTRIHSQRPRGCCVALSAGSSPINVLSRANRRDLRDSPPHLPPATTSSPTSITSTRSMASSSSSRCCASRSTCSDGSSTSRSSVAWHGCWPASPPSAAQFCSAGNPAICAPTRRGWLPALPLLALLRSWAARLRH